MMEKKKMKKIEVVVSRGAAERQKKAAQEVIRESLDQFSRVFLSAPLDIMGETMGSGEPLY